METYIMKTKRLGLRRWKDTDLEPFSKINLDPKVMEYFPKRLTTEETGEMIKSIEAKTNENGFGLYAVDLLAKKEFIGFIGLSRPCFEASFTPCVEIGWRLAYEHWGKGYATEGAEACLAFAFNLLKLPEIVSFTSLENRRSIRVMEKLHMKKAGEFMHPNIPEENPLCKHVLYRISKDGK